MSIYARCREQQKVADRMFMDFKYTPAGSPEQVRAIGTLTFLMSMWADFFLNTEVKRMDAALALGSNH